MKHLLNFAICLLLVPGCGTETSGASTDDIDVPSSTASEEGTGSSSTESTNESTADMEESGENEPSGDEDTYEDDTAETESGATDDTNATETESDGSDSIDENSTELDDSSSCTLQLRVEVRDQSGSVQRQLGDYITVVGIIENPCSVDLNY